MTLNKSLTNVKQINNNNKTNSVKIHNHNTNPKILIKVKVPHNINRSILL